MKDLPHFLCAYVQAEYHQNLPDVPAPTDDAGSFLSTRKEHEDAVGCGRAIMFFEARIRPMGGVEGQIHRLVFVEEYWPLPSDIWKGGARANRDILSSEFGCRRLYGGSPAKIYAVMKVECILGPAHIVADPIHRTIPHGSIHSSK